MYLYFMRHGQTAWNHEHKMQGQTDIPLNEVGLEQARQASERLRAVNFRACYASPLIRAHRTAEIVLAGRQIPLVVEPLLKEIAFGQFEGQSLDDFKEDASQPLHQFFYEPWDYQPGAGAESIYDLFGRGLRFLNLMMRQDYAADDKILIATHGAFVRSIVNLAANLSVGEFWRRRPLPNCGLMVVQADHQGYRLVHEGLDLLSGELP